MRLMDPRIGADPATRIRLEVIMDRDMDGKDLIQSVVRECRWESSIENVGLTRQTSTIQSHRAQVVGTSLGRPFMLFFVLFLDLHPQGRFEEDQQIQPN